MRRATVLLLLAGCAGGAPPSATALDLSRAQASWPASEIQLADLEHGRTLLVKKCGGCHVAPLPSAHRSTDWPHALDEMSARANLEPSQRVAIERYLVTLAAR